METKNGTTTGTVKLHRLLKTTTEKLYKAFLDADALSKWLPPYGFTCHVDKLEARVGGTYHAKFTNFSTGNGHSFGGTYLELKPGERIVYNDRFDSAALPGDMRTTVTLRKVVVGAELSVVQEGIPAAIPAEACYLGWQESLMQLAKLVEPEIPDGM